MYFIFAFLFKKKKLARDIENLNSCSFLPNLEEEFINQGTALVIVEMG